MGKIKTYQQGLIDGITRFAWWKDGIEYVGSGMYTLKNAIDEALNETKEEISIKDIPQIVYNELKEDCGEVMAKSAAHAIKTKLFR